MNPKIFLIDYTEVYNEYNERHPFVCNILLSKITNQFDVEDIAQEIFLLFEQIENQRKWLSGVVFNKVREYLRGKQHTENDIELIINNVRIACANGFRDTHIIIKDISDNTDICKDSDEKFIFDLIAYWDYGMMDVVKATGHSYKNTLCLQEGPEQCLHRAGRTGNHTTRGLIMKNEKIHDTFNKVLRQYKLKEPVDVDKYLYLKKRERAMYKTILRQAGRYSFWMGLVYAFMQILPKFGIKATFVKAAIALVTTITVGTVAVYQGASAIISAVTSGQEKTALHGTGVTMLKTQVAAKSFLENKTQVKRVLVKKQQ